MADVINKAANILKIPNNKYQDYLALTTKYLMGLLPDNCGTNARVSQLGGDLYEVTYDNGIGQEKTFYFRKGDPQVEYCGGEGTICFKVVKEEPNTPQTRKLGVKGDYMIFINECGGVN